MNKAQIKQKINKKNTELKNAKNEKQQYQNLQNKVNSIINQLNNSLKNLYSAQGYLRDGYKGNSRNQANNLTDDTIRKTESIKRELSNTTISGINSKIRELTSKINSLNTEINKLWRDYYRAES